MPNALRSPAGLTEMSWHSAKISWRFPLWLSLFALTIFGNFSGLSVHAGLVAYTSWVPTTKLLLQSEEPPCFFTDYCEEAAERAADMCQALCSSGRKVEVALNPWRSPLRDMRAGTALPSCSNAFVISVL